MNIFKRVHIPSKYHLVLLGLILISAAMLRFIHLGYSDFQGDEFKAFLLLEPGQTLSNFLLSQRKGPIQFVITYLLHFINPEYDHQLLMRSPFALAGFWSVYFFYKFVSQHFHHKTALYATLFFATNGFLVAFSRIVQYQSFVILFMILSLYCFGLSLKSDRWKIKGIYFGFIFWALSILSHYDGIFIFPFVAFLLFQWSIRNSVNLKILIKSPAKVFSLAHIIYGGLVFCLLLALFYVPFLLNLDAATQSYWTGRLVGTGGKISSSLYLFSVYQPIYVSHIYLLLFMFGVVSFMKDLMGIFVLDAFLKLKLKMGKSISLLPLLLNMRFEKTAALLTWFLVAFFFMEILVSIPGTHIYVYIIPMLIFLGAGMKLLDDLVHFLFRRLSMLLIPFGVISLFLFLFLQSYFLFVDHKREYPWESEKFLLWEFGTPTPAYHLSIFGFPYFRNWEEVGDYVMGTNPTIACPKNKQVTNCPFKVSRIDYYSTNERSSIVRNHINMPKDANVAGYFVYVLNPQTFTNEVSNEKASYWISTYEPVKSYATCRYTDEDDKTNYFLGLTKKCTDRNVVEIFYMPPGGLDPILNLGF